MQSAGTLIQANARNAVPPVDFTLVNCDSLTILQNLTSANSNYLATLDVSGLANFGGVINHTSLFNGYQVVASDSIHGGLAADSQALATPITGGFSRAHVQACEADAGLLRRTFTTSGQPLNDLVFLAGGRSYLRCEWGRVGGGSELRRVVCDYPLQLNSSLTTTGNVDVGGTTVFRDNISLAYPAYASLYDLRVNSGSFACSNSAFTVTNCNTLFSGAGGYYFTVNSGISPIALNGPTTASKDLTVGTTFTDTLTVNATANFNAQVTTAPAKSVTLGGATTCSSTLQVVGATTCSGALSVGGTAGVTGLATFTAGLKFANQTMAAYGSVTTLIAASSYAICTVQPSITIRMTRIGSQITISWDTVAFNSTASAGAYIAVNLNQTALLNAGFVAPADTGGYGQFIGTKVYDATAGSRAGWAYLPTTGILELQAVSNFTVSTNGHLFRSGSITYSLGN